ncbi:MAG TPA: tetraacyldisaccharide 4'-kinase [Candidatus Eisenbacteria bacterium]
MAARLSEALLGAGESLYAAAWEWRRRAYARGWLRTQRAGMRVVSVGNLSVGGAGKTTLALHLVRLARARGIRAAVVARNYRPGPAGAGDESLLYARAFPEGDVYAGASKRALALEAAAAGCRLAVVDDGFSTWSLERDLDLVLLDSRDPWGGGHLLPRGRLREPRRALQRAGVVVVTRLGPSEDPAPFLAEARRYAPAALMAAARHRVRGAARLTGARLEPGARVWVVTATGNPRAVEESAREAGFEVAGHSHYRDHHWFGTGEIARDLRRAGEARATLLVTAKDAVRWPKGSARDGAAVLEVEWEWVSGGREVEARVLEGLA